MTELSPYRGAAGEVLRGYIRPATLVTVVWVILATGLLTLLAWGIARLFVLPQWLVFPLWAIAVAPVVGLFALPARAGKLRAGFLEAVVDHHAGLGGFVLRYGALSLAWGLGLALLLLAVRARIGGFLFVPQFGADAVVIVLLTVVFVVVSLVAPAFTLLVAVRCDTVGEMFTADPWIWIFRDRRGDLPSFFCSLLGGIVLFYVLYLPVMVVAAAILLAVSKAAAIAAGVFAYIAPLASAPILYGRLAGAFAYADSLDARDLLGEAQRPLAPAGPAVRRVQPSPAGRGYSPPAPQPGAAPARPPAAAPPRGPGAVGTGIERTPPIALVLERIREKAMTDLPGAIADAGEALAANPAHAPAAFTLATLQKQAGLADEARSSASRAIQLAVAGGAGAVALETFLAFHSEANRLALDAGTWMQLARMLLARRDYANAAWCHRAAAATGTDTVAAQKGMIHVAEEAVTAGMPAQALAIYESFLAAFPDSPLAGFVADAAEVVRRKK